MTRQPDQHARERGACAVGASPELASIRERVEAATPGPWTPGALRLHALNGPVCDFADAAHDFPNHVANQTFIAHARTDVPALLDEVERLRKVRDSLAAENDALRADLAHGWGQPPSADSSRPLEMGAPSEAQEGAADVWRDIASAPKDGAPVLVVVAGYWPQVCHWVTTTRDGSGHWASSTGKRREGIALTHWLPLPAAPTKEPSTSDPQEDGGGSAQDGLPAARSHPSSNQFSI